ncbi:MAG TPA: hypothetical protein VFS36_08020 [Chitinophagaceae bacterium]|jgi:hypothetical protein|nr:hypothetical protein [Chitinophagaceae bacterium]
MKKISLFLAMSYGLLQAASGQSLSFQEIIKAVKTGQGKPVYNYAKQKGMMGEGLKVGKEVDYATQDVDKEYTVGIYYARVYDKNFFTWSLEIDSFVTTHRIQAIYTVPAAEHTRIKKYLATNKYTKTQRYDAEYWEKDGIVVEFSTNLDEVLVYVKL